VLFRSQADSASSKAPASIRQVQGEPSPKAPARKKNKKTASRARDPRNAYFMTYDQFHSYGYFRPW
jgi:hypothetical protein